MTKPKPQKHAHATPRPKRRRPGANGDIRDHHRLGHAHRRDRRVGEARARADRGAAHRVASYRIVKDEKHQIQEAIRGALSHADVEIVFLTGGPGSRRAIPPMRRSTISSTSGCRASASSFANIPSSRSARRRSSRARAPAWPRGKVSSRPRLARRGPPRARADSDSRGRAHRERAPQARIVGIVARKPLIVAVGPFGAGKSTCVRRLARQALARGIRPVLVSWQWDPFDEANDRDEGVETVAAVRGGADPAALLRAAGEGARSGRSSTLPARWAWPRRSRFVARRRTSSSRRGSLGSSIPNDRRSPTRRGSRGRRGSSSTKSTRRRRGRPPRSWGRSRSGSAGSRWSRRSSRRSRSRNCGIGLGRARPAPRRRARGRGRRNVGFRGAARSPARRRSSSPPIRRRGRSARRGSSPSKGSRGCKVLQVTGRSGGLRRCHLSSPPPQGILWIAENPEETDLWARLGLEARVEPLAAP